MLVFSNLKNNLELKYGTNENFTDKKKKRQILLMMKLCVYLKQQHVV